MRKSMLFGACSAMLICGVAIAQGGFLSALPPKSEQGIVAQRDFFVLTEAGQKSAVVAVLKEDDALKQLQVSRTQARAKAIAECKTVACLDASFRWSDGEIAAVSGRLLDLAETKGAMKLFAKGLRASGEYPLYKAQDDAHLLATAWGDAAKAINHIVDVYGDGVAPHYDKIDSMRYDTKSKYYFQTVRSTAMLIDGEASTIDDVFFPEMKFAVMLLAANGRMDAARDWPLERSVNAAAVARVRSIHWEKYPYSVIVVPGQGSQLDGEAFSPMGRAVVELAVRLYREGKAPFLLVSGGTVHPSLTKYCEAYEMKRELMTQWNVPESAILVEPYARHTTTNFRNAVREMVRYGLPMKKFMVVASDYEQINSIASSKFDARCMNEMHLLPYSNKRKISANEISMQPDVVALQVDANDPMDP